MLTILGRPTSINVRKVLWTADEVGAAYRHEAEWADDKSVNTPEFLRLNPNALVPVVLDEGAVLWESNPICRYLAAKHARIDLLPVEPLARVEVERWMDWQATTLTTSSQYAFMGLVRRASNFQDPEGIARSVKGWNRAISVLEDAMAHGAAYVAAGHFTVADVVIGLSIHRWRITPIKHIDAPALDRYMERVRQRPAARWLLAEFPL